MNDVALGLIEFDSIAAGITAGDAMVKRAPITSIIAGTVQPGKYLVLISGEVAEVQESMDAGRSSAGATRDEVFLPRVHPTVVEALRGVVQPAAGPALGIVETKTVATCISAADAGVKGATVVLRSLRLADGLGGKAFLLFSGDVADVEAAVEIAARVVPETERVGMTVIASLHSEMDGNLAADTRFGMRARGESSW